MYLTATYIATALDGRPHSNTNQAYNEVISFVRKIRNSDLSGANVILDLRNKEVLKCRGKRDDVPSDTPPDFAEIFGYYYQHYKTQIDSYLQAFGITVQKEIHEDSTEKIVEGETGK